MPCRKSRLSRRARNTARARRPCGARLHCIRQHPRAHVLVVSPRHDRPDYSGSPTDHGLQHRGWAQSGACGHCLTRPQSYQVTNSVVASALRTVLGTDRATRCGQDAVITRAFGGQPRVLPRVAGLTRKLEGIDRVCGLRTCLPQCPSTAHTTGAVVHSPTYSSRSTTPANLRADAV